MIDRYLQTRYVRGGRGPVELDCWGLVRLARHEIYGKPLLPACTDARPGNLRVITRSCHEVAGCEGLQPGPAVPGSIATAWSARLCVHVGLVVQADGRRWVLETDEPVGPCITPLRAFEARYSRVVYYAD